MPIPDFPLPTPPPQTLVAPAQLLAMNVQDMLCSPIVIPSSPASETSSTSGASSLSSPTSVTSDMLKRGWIAPFLLHLHQMLRRENPKIIRWTDDGLAFQILDKEAMTNQILPKYFKNKNFASFQRQLNYFGFRKWSKARAENPTYSREHFSRDNYSAMSLVKRQSKKSRKRKASDDDSTTPVKRPATMATLLVPNDRCKPILPRPESATIAPQSPVMAMTPTTSHDAAFTPSMAPTASLSPLQKIPVAPAVNPFCVPAPRAPMSLLPALSGLPALSSARQIPLGCKLPSLRELSASGALLPAAPMRPQWLA